MSYYAEYSVDFHGIKDQDLWDSLMPQVCKEINDLFEEQVVEEDGQFYNPIKWAGFEDDMREVSKKFPGTVIQFHWKGESITDVGISYFCDGKHQGCPAKFDEFDPEKLT